MKFDPSPHFKRPSARLQSLVDQVASSSTEPVGPYKAMGGGPHKEHLLITLYTELPEDAITRIRDRFPYIDISQYPLQRLKVFKDETQNKREGDKRLKALWRSATILVTLGSLPPKPEDCPNLNLIHLCSAGVDHYLNHPILTDSKIPITTSSGIHGPPISEYVLMTLLIAAKQYNVLHLNQLNSKWSRPDNSKLYDHAGQRIGILGYGSIGRAVARLSHAMGMTVLAYTASPRSTPEARQDNGFIVPGTGDPNGEIPTAWYSGHGKEALHTFLSANLDYLILTLPLTPATRHLISSEEFGALSSRSSVAGGPFIVNISRGGIIDQPSLLTALKEGKVRGAALDVTEPEPLPSDSELWAMENVIITPHISGNGVQYLDRAFEVLTLNLERKEKGKKLVNEVQRDRGY